MDWFVAIIIPLIVSVIVWTLTYIAPYIIPRQLTSTILFFTYYTDPKDPSEIRLYINQFIKYDDWKRLTAKGRLYQIFMRKMEEIEISQFDKWKQINDNIVSMPIEDVINKLNDYLSILRNYRSGKSKDLTKPICINVGDIEYHLKKDDKNGLKNRIMKFETDFKSHTEAKVWLYMDINLKKLCKGKLESYVNELTPIEITYLLGTGHEFTDWDGSIYDKEGYIQYELKEFKPHKCSEKELSSIFNDIMFYLDYPHNQQKKEKFIADLTLGLSNHSKSQETLLDIINDVREEIESKDMADLSKKYRLYRF